ELPRVVDKAVVASSEDAVHKAAVREQLVELLGFVLTGARLLPHPPDAHDDREVQQRDHIEERARDERSDHTADALEAILEARRCLRGDGNADRHQEYDRRVAERKEQANREWSLALLQQVARRIVDRRDVVGVERVSQAERVCEYAGARVEQLPVTAGEV